MIHDFTKITRPIEFKKKTGKFMQDSSYLPAFSIIAPFIGPKSPSSAIMSMQEYS